MSTPADPPTPRTGLRAVIADDEPGARWHLRALLEGCRVHTVAECATGGDVLATVARVSPDLVCLDVRMPDPDGVEVARRLAGCVRPVVVFTTGYADYAAAAFDLDAADYLVKPLTAPRVTEAVRRVRVRLRRVEAGFPEVGVGIPGAALPGVTLPISRIFIPAGDHRLALAPEAIRFVEAREGACLVHADDGVHPVRTPLARLEQMLAPHGFLRTHRAYLVNVSRVRALVPWSRHVHSLLLDEGKETHGKETHVPVAKSRLAAFRRNVIWIAETGGLHHGPWDQGQGGDRRRRKPGSGPGDR